MVLYEMKYFRVIEIGSIGLPPCEDSVRRHWLWNGKRALPKIQPRWCFDLGLIIQPPELGPSTVAKTTQRDGEARKMNASIDLLHVWANFSIFKYPLWSSKLFTTNCFNNLSKGPIVKEHKVGEQKVVLVADIVL